MILAFVLEHLLSMVTLTESITFNSFRYMSRFQCIEKDLSDNCNVNVYFHGDELYTLGETSKLRRIDPDNLETIGDEVKLITSLFYSRISK